MWAIYDKNVEKLVHDRKTQQYLIFASKPEAWKFLLTCLEESTQDNYDVIEIRWTHA